MTTFDPQDVLTQVKATYRKVAEDPHGEFHFATGRALAERLGYATADLNRIPAEAIESFQKPSVCARATASPMSPM